MTRVALKGLASRPVRTLLTMLAIVLGVGMVSAAFTLTDTMRGAADSLSSAAYDGTDAVVTARTAFKVDSSDDWTVQRPTVAASLVDDVRAVPQVATAVGDISDQAQIIGRDGKPSGDGPYFGTGFDSKVAGAEKLTAFRLQDGRWAVGPGEVVIDATTAEKQRYGIGDRVRISTRGEASVVRGGRRRPLRDRQVARHRLGGGVRPRDRAGAVRQAGPLRLRAGGRQARRAGGGVRAAIGESSATAPRSRRPRPTTASRSTA